MNESVEGLPVPGQRVNIQFDDCCVNGQFTGTVKAISENETYWPELHIEFEEGFLFNGHFTWTEVGDAEEAALSAG